MGSWNFARRARSRAESGWTTAVATLLLILAAGGAPAWAQDDPPGRVGRLNYVQGSVSYLPAGSEDWVAAGSTRPITSGDRVWISRDARAELSIGSAVLRADHETGLKVLQLDDSQAQFELSEGSVAVHVRNLDPNERLEIATPNLAFDVNRPGDYRIQVDPDNNVTTVTVQHGQGTAYSDDGQLPLGAPGYARFVGGNLDQQTASLPRRDDFDGWVASRMERAESRPTARYVPRDMVGYEDLDDYGSWQQEPDYGPVWVPHVTVAAWAPYRYGHWAWVAPWGWTWIDDEPWGFAPFHYGRWAFVRNTWCWVPGPVVRRPYYAPALVAFVGSPGASLTISSGPAVAWFPLGPREEYRPVYHASTTYITQINRVVVEQRGGPRPPPGQYVNRNIPSATTALPARAFVEGHSVAREQIRVSQHELQQAPVAGTMPALAPVKTSLVGQARRVEAPAGAARERQVVTTHMPAAPPVERDELARRFAQSGQQIKEAGPTLADQPPRRAEGRENKDPRVVTPGREAPPPNQAAQERRPPATEAQPAPLPQERDRANRGARPPETAGPPPQAGEPQRAERQGPPSQADRPPQERDRSVRAAPPEPGGPAPQPGEAQRPERQGQAAQEGDRGMRSARPPETIGQPPQGGEAQRGERQQGPPAQADRPPQERDRSARGTRPEQGSPPPQQPGEAQRPDRQGQAAQERDRGMRGVRPPETAGPPPQAGEPQRAERQGPPPQTDRPPQERDQSARGSRRPEEANRPPEAPPRVAQEPRREEARPRPEAPRAPEPAPPPQSRQEAARPPAPPPPRQEERHPPPQPQQQAQRETRAPPPPPQQQAQPQPQQHPQAEPRPQDNQKEHKEHKDQPQPQLLQRGE